MDKVTDVYTFVYEEENRPVRWYPEETQRAIEAMITVDPDSLYLTEFMRLHAAQAQPAAALDAVMRLEIDYYPGQLTVVVLGDTSDPENIVWTPVESRVTEIGKLEFEVPQELMEALQGEDVLFTLLVTRPGDSRVIVVPETTTIPGVLPSKTAEDETHIKKTIRKDGTPWPDDFELLIVPETDAIAQELARIRERLAGADDDSELAARRQGGRGALPAGRRGGFADRFGVCVASDTRLSRNLRRRGGHLRVRPRRSRPGKP